MFEGVHVLPLFCAINVIFPVLDFGLVHSDSQPITFTSFNVQSSLTHTVQQMKIYSSIHALRESVQ